MRFVVFFQYESLRDGAKIYDAVTLEREKSPDKYPKQLTPTYAVLGDMPDLKEKIRGFYVVEADRQEQIDEYHVFMHSKAEELGFKDTSGVKAILPLVGGSDTMPKWKALHK